MKRGRIPDRIALEDMTNPDLGYYAKLSVLEWTFIGIVELQTDIPMPVCQFKFDPAWRWRCDFAWPDYKLIVECEGGSWIKGRHVRPIGFQNDCVKYNRMSELGYRLLRFTAEMLNDAEATMKSVRRVLAWEKANIGEANGQS